jgi:hypothetical protein
VIFVPFLLLLCVRDTNRSCPITATLKKARVRAWVRSCVRVRVCVRVRRRVACIALLLVISNVQLKRCCFMRVFHVNLFIKLLGRGELVRFLVFKQQMRVRVYFIFNKVLLKIIVKIFVNKKNQYGVLSIQDVSRKEERRPRRKDEEHKRDMQESGHTNQQQ